MKGRERDCGNSEISHSVEVGVRADDFYFPFLYVAGGVMHETLEVKCEEEGISSVPGILKEVKKKKFGGEYLGDKLSEFVEVDSNLYGIPVEQWGHLIKTTPSGRYTKKAMLQGLDDLREYTSEDILSRFDKQFIALEDTIKHSDINEINNMVKERRSYSIVKDFKLRLYENYIADIFKDASRRLLDEKDYDTYDVGIVVKGLDGIDNLRTMGDSRPVMERTLRKIEIFLDYADGFLDNPRLREAEHEKIWIVYGSLKDQLIEQLIVRRNALGGYGNTRYIPIKEFIDNKIIEFSKKYEIDTELIEERVRNQNIKNPRFSFDI